MNRPTLLLPSVTASIVLATASCYWYAATAGQEPARGMHAHEQQPETAPESPGAAERMLETAPDSETGGIDTVPESEGSVEWEDAPEMETVYEYGVLPENEYMPACNCRLPVVNGRLHGTMIAYDDQERVVAHLEHKDGILHGESRAFFPSGKLFAARQIKEGFPTGIGYNYFEDGTVAMRDNYDDNTQVEYYRNGNKFVEGRFAWEGRTKHRHGVWNFYLPDGRLYLIEQYRLGRTIGENKRIEPNDEDWQAMQARLNFSTRVKDHWPDLR